MTRNATPTPKRATKVCKDRVRIDVCRKEKIVKNKKVSGIWKAAVFHQFGSRLAQETALLSAPRQSVNLKQECLMSGAALTGNSLGCCNFSDGRQKHSYSGGRPKYSHYGIHLACSTAWLCCAVYATCSLKWWQNLKTYARITTKKSSFLLIMRWFATKTYWSWKTAVPWLVKEVLGISAGLLGKWDRLVIFSMSLRCIQIRLSPWISLQGHNPKLKRHNLWRDRKKDGHQSFEFVADSWIFEPWRNWLYSDAENSQQI